MSKQAKSRPRDRYLVALSLILTTTSPALQAGNLGIAGGYFDMVAETSAGRNNLSNLGVYRFLYQIPVSDQFAAIPGYSFYFTSLNLGDAGYGFDMEFAYYPLTYNQPLISSGNKVSWHIAESFRPSIGIAFHQRQFQVVRSTYGGIGMTINLDYQLSPTFQVFFKGELIQMRGPLNSKLSEKQIALGLSRAI